MDSRLVLRNKAIKLRRTGSSYGIIATRLRVSKSTICYWLKDLDWSQEIKKQLEDRERIKWSKRLIHLNNLKKKKYDLLYRQEALKARQDFKKYESEKLFLIGLSIYWGEGDRVFRNGIVRVGNIDYKMLAIFKTFLVQFCKVDIKKIRGYIVLYSDNNIDDTVNYWSRKVGLGKEKFYKPTLINGRRKANILTHGTCFLSVNNKLLKKRVLTWLDCLKESY